MLQATSVGITLERENHPFKEEMVLCLMELVKDQDAEQAGTDEEWMTGVDCGTSKNALISSFVQSKM